MEGGDRGTPPSPYRGEDRRRFAGNPTSPAGRTYWLALGVLLAVWAFLAWMPLAGRLGSVDLRVATQVLQAASTVVAVGIGVMGIAKWRLSGDTPALWVGVGTLVYGVVRLGAVELLPQVVTSGWLNVLAGWLRPAALLVVVAVLARGLVLTQVDTTHTPLRVTVLALAATVVLVGALTLLPEGVASWLDGAGTDAARSYAASNELGLVVIAWAVLSVCFAYQGIRRRRWLFAWYALLLLALALGEVIRVLAAPPVQAGLLAREVLRLAGLLLATIGATREILDTYRDASTRLARSEYSVSTAAERMRLDQLLAEERAHEARSALAAIEGATRTLQHYRDRLPVETQQALSTAVSGEIRRLQRLVSIAEPAAQTAPFGLAEVLAPLAANETARGVHVSFDVPPDLTAHGSDTHTRQVVQTLLDNARRHAPDQPVTIRAELERGWVVIRVGDTGPGVAPEQREAIFRRGVRGERTDDVPGSGLGLYVATKLMREQGGGLWVDARPGGGASFALSLPAAAQLAHARQPVDHPGDARQLP